MESTVFRRKTTDCGPFFPQPRTKGAYWDGFGPPERTKGGSGKTAERANGTRPARLAHGFGVDGALPGPVFQRLIFRPAAQNREAENQRGGETVVQDRN